LLYKWRQIGSTLGEITPEDLSRASCTFVASCGRSGSRWLSFAAEQLHSQVIGVHEALPNLRALSAGVYHGVFAESKAAREIFHMRSHHIATVGTLFRHGHYLESNLDLFSLGPCLRSAFPRSRFVGLVRDIRTWLPSAVSWTLYRFLRPRCPEVLEQWSGWSATKKAAWFWVERNGIIAADASQMFKLEELTTPEGWDVFWRACCLGRMCTDYPEPVLNFVVNHGTRPRVLWEDILKVERDAIMEMAGPLMGQFGYI